MGRRTRFAALCVSIVGLIVLGTWFFSRGSVEERTVAALRKAAAYDEQARHEDAVITLRSALRRAPSDWRIHAGLARSYTASDRAREGLLHYAAALQMGAAEEAFLREYAAACLRGNATRELLKPAERLIALNPRDADANIWMARALALDSPGEAAAYAARAAEYRPDAQTYLLLARLHVRNRDASLAEECLEAGLGRLQADPELLAGLAFVQVEQGKEREARRQIRRAVAAAEDSEPAKKASVYATAAEVYRRLGDDARGIELLERLVGLEPRRTAFRMALAQRYAAAGDSEKAIKSLRDALHVDESNDELRGFLVEVLLKSRKIAHARSEFERLSPGNAASPYGAYLEGAVLLARGEVWLAEEPLRRAIHEDPNLAQARVVLGACYWQMGRVASAAAEFERVLDASPSHADALVWLARCRLAAGQAAEAQDLAAKALEQQKADAQARELLLACLARRGKVDELRRMLRPPDADLKPGDALALAQAQAAARRLDAAAKTVEAVLARQPDSQEAAIMMSRILEMRKEAELAEQRLAAFCRDHPEAEAAALEHAALLARSGKPDAAIDALRGLAAKLPGSAAVRAALAEMHTSAGDQAGAVESLAEACRIEPDNLDLHRRLAAALIELKDFARSRSEIDRLRLRCGESFDVQALESRLLAEQGRLDEAAAALIALSRRWPREAEAQELAAAVLLRKGDLAGAISALEAARDTAPNDAAVRARLRDAYLSAGFFDKAAAEARAVVDLKPAAEGDLQRLALSLAGAHDTAKAAEILRRLVADNPANAEYRIQLAQILASDGQAAEAQQHLDAALTGEPAPAVIWGACNVYWRAGDLAAARSLIERTASAQPRIYHSLLAQHHVHAGDEQAAEAEFARLRELAPDDILVMAAVGDFYAAIPGRHEDALKAYDRAAALAPGYDYARKQKASVLALAGRFGQAEELLSKLARERPGDADLQARLADLALRQAGLAPDRAIVDAAQERARTLLSGSPHDARAQFYAAVAAELATDRDSRKAEACLNRAIDIDPGFVEARLLRARLERRAGRLDDAERDCRAALKANPASTSALLALGDVLRDRKAGIEDYRALADEFRANPAAKLVAGLGALKDDPARAGRLLRETLGDRPAWEMLRAGAEQLAARGQAAGALPALHEFVRGHPAFVPAYRTLADVSAAAKDPRTAVEVQRQAYALSGRGYPDLRRTVAFMVNAKSTPQAASFLRDHLKKSADDMNARLLLAQVLGQLGRVKESIIELHKVLGAQPENLQAHLTLATAFASQRLYSKAVIHYQKVLLREPSHAVAANNLAFILAEHLNRAADAESVILPALQKKPKAADLLDTYGWVLYKAGRPRDAAQALRRSLDARPDVPPTMYHLAIVLKRQGKLQEARGLLERALRIDPAFGNSRDARRLLKTMP